MGKLYKTLLPEGKVWSCDTCNTHLAYHDHIVSKNFQGRHGRAYLFSNVVNIALGETVERRLLTGIHIVADIHCNICNTILGWKYLEAFDEAQKYKENKYIVEKARMTKDKSWT